VKLGTVVIDCADPGALAEFWRKVLEWHTSSTATMTEARSH